MSWISSLFVVNASFKMLGNSSDDDIVYEYEKKAFDDEIEMIESSNSGLLIENERPVRIYLEGFPISEFVELMKIVKDHGGEISCRVQVGVIVLSRLTHSVETDSPRFDVKWLHDSISSNRILNPSKYQLELPNGKIKQELEVEDYQPNEPINVRLQLEKQAGDGHSLREPLIKIPKVSSLPQKHASSNIIDENPVRKGTSEIHRTPECSRRSQPLVYTICDCPEENIFYTTSSLPIVSSSTVKLSTSNTQLEVKEKNDHPLEPINIGLQQGKDAACYCNMRQTNASPNVNENTVPEDTFETRNAPNRRICSQQPVQMSCDSSKEKKSSKSKHLPFTDGEDRAMIQYLIDNDAIDIAAGVKIWEKMHKERIMRHSVSSMVKRFCRSLRYRIRDFTSDEETLEKFKSRDIKLKGRKRRRSY